MPSDMAEAVLAITYAHAIPIISNVVPRITIPGQIRIKLTNLLINTCLLFSIPRSLDVKIDVTAVGITTTLIIWIASIDSVY